MILSHGFRGNAEGFASLIGPRMVQWGLVCIAVNYTHSEGVPIGRPGDARGPGASRSNVQRAQMSYELLRRLGYGDVAALRLRGRGE